MTGFPASSDNKESTCSVGDPGSIPGSWKSPGEWSGNPLQYSCLENPLDRGTCQATVHGVTTSWTRLNDFTWYINNKDLDFFLPFFLFLDWITFQYMAVSLLIYPFISWGTFGFLLFDSYIMLLWIFIYMFLCRHKLSSDASRLILLVTIKQIKPNENISLKQQ